MIYKALVYMPRKRIGVCGKVCFDKKGAQTKKNFLERIGRERLRIYYHGSCDAWHLTKLNRKRK